MVQIFRAKDSKDNYFNPNDYVTLSHKFAVEHAESNHVYFDEKQIVIRKLVPANQVAEASNPGEYFYIGPKIPGTVVYKTLGDEYQGEIPDLRSSSKLNESEAI